MFEVRVERELNVSPEKTWELVANFGDVSWLPLAEKVDVEGDGVGMIRHISTPGMATVHERLEVLDHGKRVLEYSIAELGFLKVRDYRARAEVSDLGDGRTRLRWSCTAEPDGASEEEAKKLTEGFYDLIVTWVADHLAKI